MTVCTGAGVPRIGFSLSVPTLLAVASVVLPVHTVAQTFEGRVIDERDDRPVSGALVRLVDAGGTAGGLANAASNLGGFASPVMIGWALDLWGDWTAVLLLTVAANFAASVLWWFANRGGDAGPRPLDASAQRR